MKEVIRILPLFLFVFLLDRFFFLPERMHGTWEYEEGIYKESPITFETIAITNNFEISINQSRKSQSFYLLGCYFGRLYLLDLQTLDYTKYTKVEPMNFQ